MRRNSPEIHPVAGAIGAEIAGVDLAGEIDDDTIAAIRRAWLDHLVIFLRGQNLPPARFLAFARRFGEPIEYPFVNGIDGFPLITPVVKLANERVNFGGLWHSDTAYLETPPIGTMLIAREDRMRERARTDAASDYEALHPVVRPIPKPAGRRSTSMAVTPCGSGT